MKNREALKNARFEEKPQPLESKGAWLELKNDKTKFERIAVNHFYLHVNIYLEANKPPVHKFQATDLDDLAKMLYGYLGYQLDFTAKTKYDWETVFDELPVEQHNKFVNAEIAINELANYGIIDHTEVQSMIAKLKLNIIIQQIDKDYPRTDGVTHSVVMNDRGTLKACWVAECNFNGSIIELENLKGAKILLDQNPQLLKNLFKIETDATGED